MTELTSLSTAEQFIKNQQFSFLYISKNNCGVCQALLPQVTNLLKKFPLIKLGMINADNVEEIVGRFSIFAAPTLLFFVDGKEYIREARFVHIQVLEEKISRIYQMLVTEKK